MTKIEKLWQIAREQVMQRPLHSGAYKLLRLDAEFPHDFFAGIDADNCVLLALGVNFRPPSIDIGSPAIEYFRQKRQDSTWLMVLRLQRADLEHVFGRLCQDLVDAAFEVSEESTLVQLFCTRLDLWRRLFQGSGSGLLGKNEVKGLVAELLVLKSLLNAPQEDLLSIVAGWVGPLGAKQDFMYARKAIEVKAVAQDADEIRISSLDQLDSTVPLDLKVFVLRDSVANEKLSINIVELVTAIEGILSQVAKGLQIFRERLLAAHYVENEYYESIYFGLQSETSYAVLAGFPKLVAEAMPLGVKNVSYSIRLTSIQSFATTNMRG